nr:uncharacterized protein LOC123281942 [Equus asinus]
MAAKSGQNERNKGFLHAEPLRWVEWNGADQCGYGIMDMLGSELPEGLEARGAFTASGYSREPVTPSILLLGGMKPSSIIWALKGPVPSPRLAEGERPRQRELSRRGGHRAWGTNSRSCQHLPPQVPKLFLCSAQPGAEPAKERDWSQTEIQMPRWKQERSCGQRLAFGAAAQPAWLPGGASRRSLLLEQTDKEVPAEENITTVQTAAVSLGD